MNNIKVMVAMSGGVDSSVAAALLNNLGYSCIGTTMRLYDARNELLHEEKACGSADDLLDAKRVADKLKIPFDIFDYRKEFQEEVIRRFICAYENGNTPNPCIDCNRHMKFGCLHRKARALGCDYVATGHYARIEYDEKYGRYLLKKGLDASKDQSYVLYTLTQEQLAHTLFPLGNYTKEQIRKIAEANGFVNAHKKDSQDICFVPDGDYAKFIRKQTQRNYPEGNFVDSSGTVLGMHKGIINYTIGQRRGLGLSLKEPMYVIEKRMESNEVVLGRNEDLFSNGLIAGDFNWIAYDMPDKNIRVTAKTRYSQKEQAATARAHADGRVEVVFDEPVRAVTSGQSVVLYENDIVVGGGKIEKCRI